MNLEKLTTICTLLIFLTLSTMLGPQLYRTNLSNNKAQKKIFLQELLQGEFQEYNTSFSLFLSFEKHEGLYSTFTKSNLVDESNSLLTAFAREYIGIYDNNMFVTNFIVLNLIESFVIGDIDLDIKKVEKSVRAITRFRDRNHEDGVPIYSFYEQTLNQETGKWGATHLNLIHLIKKLKNVIQYLPGAEKTMQTMEGLTKSRIPPDTDCSCVNLALGYQLAQHKKTLPDSEKIWAAANQDYEHFFKMLKKYAYRPFLETSQDVPGEISKTASYIDPRTYYYLSPYLDQIYEEAYKDSKKPEFAIFTTWISDLENDQELFPDVVTPEGANDVDLAVNANALFGISSFLLREDIETSRKEKLFDDDLRMIYLSAARVLMWAVETELHLKRPDLCLVFYPSISDFYWFLARVLALLDNAESLPFKEMLEVRDLFAKTLRKKATELILREARKCTKTNSIYWEEFLGNYGGKFRGEDRLFTTSIMMNALIDIWSTRSRKPNGKVILSFKPDIPQNVTQVIKQGERYILENAGNFGMSYENVFFSELTKGNESIIYYFPGNVAFNSSKIPIDPTEMVLQEPRRSGIHYFMKGYAPNEIYSKMMDQKFFGKKVPTNFTGFNKSKFIFWSSPAMTYSMALLALLKTESLNMQ